MSNSASHAALPYPIKNARYTILVPYLDADGDPLDPTTPDTEFSGDAGAFADCAEEVTTITGSNGTGYITLTGAETNYSMLAIAAKVASGPKNTLATLYPRNLPILESGTAGGGAAGTLTLASGTYTGLNLTGCFLRTTGGTGGGGTGGASNQARRITSYNTGTRVATVSPNWETTPDNTTTYDILLPEGILVPMLTALAPTTLARTLDVSSGGEAGVDWANVGSPTTAVNLSATTIATTQQVDLNTIKTQSVTCGAAVTIRADVGAAAAPGASNGMLIGGSNAATTFATLTVSGATTLTGNVALAAGLNITQSSANTSAVVITGNGTGHGMAITSGSGASGDGIHAVSASTDGHGIAGIGGTNNHGFYGLGGLVGSGAYFQAGGNAPGLAAYGTTNQPGIYGKGSGSGAGIHGFGGSSGPGYYAQGGATGVGLQATGGSTSGGGIVVSVTSGTGVTLPSLTVSGATTLTGTVTVTDASNDIRGIKIATGGIVAASFGAGAIDAAAIATDAIDADAIAASAVTEIQSGLSTLDAAGVRAAIGLAAANLDTQLTAIDDYIDTEVAAIKAKTDQLTFTVAGQVDANIQYVNDVQVSGVGTTGDPWGPV